jgi:hypothetical protein
MRAAIFLKIINVEPITPTGRHSMVPVILCADGNFLRRFIQCHSKKLQSVILILFLMQPLYAVASRHHPQERAWDKGRQAVVFCYFKTSICEDCMKKILSNRSLFKCLYRSRPKVPLLVTTQHSLRSLKNLAEILSEREAISHVMQSGRVIQIG